ncbi:MAG: hypothetical protein ABIE75_01480 [Candidatus Omnitrophota bacterium]
MVQTKRGVKTYRVKVEVAYVPFPSEEARRGAYYTHTKLFLRAKERMKKRERRAEIV